MLSNKSLTEFANALSSKEPAPGGGSLGFLLISLGCSVILKTVRISQSKIPEMLFKKYVDYLESFTLEFLHYVDKDAKDYQDAVKFAKTDKDKFVNKLLESVEFLIESVKKGLNLLSYITEFSSFIKDSVYSDLDCGRYAVVAGILTLIRTGYANSKYIKGVDKSRVVGELDALKIKVDKIKYTL